MERQELPKNLCWGSGGRPRSWQPSKKYHMLGGCRSCRSCGWWWSRVCPVIIPSRNDSCFLNIFPLLLYVAFQRSNSSRPEVHFVLKQVSTHRGYPGIALWWCFILKQCLQFVFTTSSAKSLLLVGHLRVCSWSNEVFSSRDGNWISNGIRDSEHLVTNNFRKTDRL